MSAYPHGVVSVDGRITSAAEATVPATDHGFLFGDSIYEVVRTRNRLPVTLAEHLARLRASAAALYLDLPWTDAEIGARMRDAVAATDFPECYVRLVVTRGVGPMTLLPDVCPRPTMVVYVLPLRTPTAEELERGARVAIPARLRNDRRALAPAAKTGNYLNNVLALVEARRAGGEDAVLVNAAGHVTEATTANVMWVRDGRIETPSHECGILAGITRAILLDALAAGGETVVEGAFPPERMTGADEVFLTGTVRGVFPVVAIDGAPVGTGRPGPVAARLLRLYEDLVVRFTTPWPDGPSPA